MAKAIRVYSGRDSHGRSVEVAERADHTWFSRSYDFNGYHNCWAKWKQCDNSPAHPVQLKNMVECGGGGEFFTIPLAERENRIEWGFSLLTIVPGSNRLRLPNP